MRLWKSLWWKLALSYVPITLIGSLLAAFSIGPMVDAVVFREVVAPPHLKALIEPERHILDGRLADVALAGKVARNIADHLSNVAGPSGLYGIRYSSDPKVSVAIYRTDGTRVAAHEAFGLMLPFHWATGPERLMVFSEGERWLSLPIKPGGTLLIRHQARFSILKNIQSSLRDAGASFWFLVIIVSLPGIALGAGLTVWLRRRLGHIAQVTDAWAKGDFSVKLRDTSQDELGRHAQSLDRMASQLQAHLATQQQLAALEERQHLARELHDNVKQQVFATGLQIHAAQRFALQDQDRTRQLLEQALVLNQSVQQDLSSLLLRLKPTDEGPQPLEIALADITMLWQQQITIHLMVPAAISLSSAMTHELRRIVNEALANTVRHAQASMVMIRVSQALTGLTLQIQDDGCGFDVNQVGQGLGLAHMRERAEALPHGVFEVVSSSDGTCLTVRFATTAQQEQLA
ncbi:ATP-binding protein [Chitinivorax sp. B]|uniref:HAMP domain-containing sensor histidine kinase n=1 Tax=Chitinivorax sp. B TaxID=2502235 RepID=UPI00148595C0|nr:ATP-binding protein [Chitinivorax sp. B]